MSPPTAGSVPDPGHPLPAGTLVLTPVDQFAAPSCVGEVAQFDTGPSGLAVHLLARVSPEVANALDSEDVWVNARMADGSVVAFRGLARLGRPGSGVIDLSGVASPIVESRRTMVRAATRVATRVRFSRGVEAGPEVEGHTIDLSRGACRIQLQPGSPMPAEDAAAEVRLSLDDVTVVAGAEVVRVDEPAGQVVMRFVAVMPEDAERIDRHVLAAVMT